MTDADDINDALLANATKPKRVRVGDEDVEQHSLADLVKAANHVAGQDAVTEGLTGFRFFQFIPPGAGGTT